MFELTQARILGGVAAAALVFAAGAFADRHFPVFGATAQLTKLGKDRDAWKHTADDNQARATAWEKSFRQAEALRAGEHGQAVQSLNDAAAACDARVAAARRSALAIHALVTKEVPKDAQGCPVRQLANPRELFDAIRPPPRGPG